MTNDSESRRRSKRPAATPERPSDASGLAPLPRAAAVLPAVAEAAPIEARPPAVAQSPHVAAHGFDPTDYKWIPVLRRPRKDGWSEARQRLFIEVLADTACVEQAARAVQMSVRSAYTLRRAPGGEAFAAAWTAALQQGALRLADVAFQRALSGTEEPVFDRDGRVIGHKTRYSERLMMFLLPERYAHAHRAERPESPPPAALAPPVTEALDRLGPAVPPDPHKLMPPEELEVELEVADIMQGELPQRDRSLQPEPPLMPLGEDFERQLEAAKLGFELGPDGELIKDEPRNDKRPGPELY